MGVMMMNARLDEVTKKLTESILGVVEKLEVTETELLKAIDFLNEVGKKGEFHLLSDVLGVSVFVDQITQKNIAVENMTPHNVEGPLYRSEAPILKTPAHLCQPDEPGDILIMHGQVSAIGSDRPIANALLDVWQANEHGDYENQDESQEDFNLRGRVLADEEGKYEIRSIVPGGYDIGKGGPVGEFLKAIGRHAWRPAHIHFKVSGEGATPLTTMLFVPEAPWLESDSIGAVKDPLIMEFKKVDDPAEYKKRGLNRPFYICEYDFKLQEAKVLSETNQS